MYKYGHACIKYGHVCIKYGHAYRQLDTGWGVRQNTVHAFHARACNLNTPMELVRLKFDYTRSSVVALLPCCHELSDSTMWMPWLLVDVTRSEHLPTCVAAAAHVPFCALTCAGWIQTMHSSYVVGIHCFDMHMCNAVRRASHVGSNLASKIVVTSIACMLFACKFHPNV